MNKPSTLPTRGCAVRGAETHPHTPSTLGARVVGTGSIALSWRGGIQPTPLRHMLYARDEGHPCVWVAALSAWGTSVACQRRRKAILAFRSGDGNLPRQDCHASGGRVVLGRHGEVRGILVSILG